MAARVGSPAWAPAWVVLSAAPTMAQRSATSSDAPRDSSAARIPLSASPAPVVSSGVTGVAGKRDDLSVGAEHGALSAEGDDDRGPRPRREDGGGGLRVGSPVSSSASRSLGVRMGRSVSSSASRGRAGAGLRMMRSPRLGRPARGGQDGVVEDLEADEADRPGRRVQPGRLLGDHGGVKAGVGAGRHGDLVLARGVDDDERQPGVLVLQATAGRDVHAFLRQPCERAAAQVVPADGPEHHHVGPHAAGSHGLVGALAPVLLHEAIALHGLTGRGQTRHAHDEVHVDRPRDDDRPVRSCHVHDHGTSSRRRGTTRETDCATVCLRVSCLP